MRWSVSTTLISTNGIKFQSLGNTIRGSNCQILLNHSAVATIVVTTATLSSVVIVSVRAVVVVVVSIVSGVSSSATSWSIVVTSGSS